MAKKIELIHGAKYVGEVDWHEGIMLKDVFEKFNTFPKNDEVPIINGAVCSDFSQLVPAGLVIIEPMLANGNR